MNGGPQPRVSSPAPGPLDLDHLGAEIGQRLAGPGAGQDAREFEHANARERALLRTGHVDEFLPGIF